MQEKLSSFVFYICLVLLTAVMIVSGAFFLRFENNRVKHDLEKTVAVASYLYETDGVDGLRLFSEYNVTLTGTDGKVIICPEQDIDGISVSKTLSDGNVLTVTCGTYFVRLYPEMAGILILGVLIALVLSIIYAKKFVKPIKELTDALKKGEVSENIKYPELEPLVDEIRTRRSEGEYMRHEFTANVTHELKTPLTSISGYAEMIETGMARPSDVKHFAEIIHHESSRMLMLVNDIIELSRLDNGAKLESPKPVDLYLLAHECADQLAASAEKRNITINVVGASTTVMGDDGKLWELIYNLTDNAINYNRDGGRVDIIVGEKYVTVKDTGIGIPPEHQKRIFERFYRVDKSHSRMTGGTGLGLSIVKHIAEQHDAKLTLKSEVNVGTEITVNFT